MSLWLKLWVSRVQTLPRFRCGMETIAFLLRRVRREEVEPGERHGCPEQLTVLPCGPAHNIQGSHRGPTAPDAPHECWVGAPQHPSPHICGEEAVHHSIWVQIPAAWPGRELQEGGKPAITGPGPLPPGTGALNYI